MIETVDLPELVAIGLLVEGEQIDELVRAAWPRLFERDTGASAFLRAGLLPEGGRQRALVGFLAARKTERPDGMTRIEIPAQRYVRLVHDGGPGTIRAAFEHMGQYARVHGLVATASTLDFGYLPGLPDTRHELHLALAPSVARLG